MSHTAASTSITSTSTRTPARITAARRARLAHAERVAVARVIVLIRSKLDAGHDDIVALSVALHRLPREYAVFMTFVRHDRLDRLTLDALMEILDPRRSAA